MVHPSTFLVGAASLASARDFNPRSAAAEAAPVPNRWEFLGGLLVVPPSVVSRDRNRLDVFALNTKSELTHKSWNGQSWSGWSSLDSTAQLLTTPVPVSWGPDRIDVFGVSPRGSVL